MQILSNYISIKFYYQIYEKEINFVALMNFRNYMSILQEGGV